MNLKKLILPFIALCILYALYSVFLADNRQVFLHSDGKTIESRGDFNEQGQGIGLHTHYYANGQKHYELTFNHQGKLDGSYTYWYQNGELLSVASYANGLQQGDYKKWDEQNNLIKHEVYRNDSLAEKIK